MLTAKEKRNQLHDMIDKIDDRSLDDAISIISKILPSVKEPEQKEARPACPYCSAASAYHYGFTKGKNRKQRYLCKTCGKSFVETTGTAVFGSHLNAKDWEKAVSDTVAGMSLDETAKALGVSHSTAFRMRHKILLSIQKDAIENPGILGQETGICELDETYVLESHKGTKTPEGYWRPARKHGAKAYKRGLSNELVCICTGIDASGTALAQTVNRALPSAEELTQVFQGRIDSQAVALTDGGKGYPGMARRCSYKQVNVEENASTYQLNQVSGFHSYIKGRYINHYHGVATKYINRYNALFSKAYGNKDGAIADLNALIHRRSRHIPVAGLNSVMVLGI